MRRRRRPGVTAAATTTVLTTGDGRGRTAAATTAVLATGRPFTTTRPTRAGLGCMSVSFGCFVVGGVDCGDDRLDGDASVCDELTRGASRGGGVVWRPQVLPDEHPGR